MTSKEVNAAPVLTIRKLLIYRCLDKDCDPWFVFWLHDEDILGVTDGKKKLYEKEMTIAERKQLAGNVSESLLSGKWANFFDSRAFTLEFNGDEVEISYVARSVNLNRVKSDDVHDRIAQVLNHAVDGMMTASKKLAQHEIKEKAEYMERVAAKRDLYRPEPKIASKTRRNRQQPTGLRFED